MSRSSPLLIFLALFTINCILWSQARYQSAIQFENPPVRGTSLAKRIILETSQISPPIDVSSRRKQCRPKHVAPQNQCTHVDKHCLNSQTFLSIQYLRTYFCAKPELRPLVFAGLIVWLLFLFSTLGISASDFFTPNLATIAQLLGLDENVAGVTFLAFGNGSPDVFSTFSAMRADSGSLAIGELIGAASFIVSCVVGSMCIIKPFKVHRGPFLRDVGFSTMAVTLMVVILWDGKINSTESASMIGLYLFYVCVVVVGSWWERRQEKRRRMIAAMRSEYQDDDIRINGAIGEPYRDDPTPVSSSRTLQVLQARPRAISVPSPPRLDVNSLRSELPFRPHTSAPSRTSSTHRLSHLPSFSLLGAIEFRQVVTSLQAEAASSSLSMFETPVTPFAGAHYYHSRPSSSAHSRELDPWDAALSSRTNTRTQSHYLEPPSRDEQFGIEDGRIAESPVYLNGIPIPTISHTPASPSIMGDLPTPPAPTRLQKALWLASATFYTVCPSLRHFRSKSMLGKIASLFSAPAVMGLTLTLPVVVEEYGCSLAREKIIPLPRSLSTEFEEEEGIERMLRAEEEVEEDIHGNLGFDKSLTAAQCIFGPLFCVGVLFNGNEYELWILLGAGVAGVAAATVVGCFADKGNNLSGRMVRCMMGFFVAIVWIMAIADEVVNVLQTFGYIFGLSEALIGLTIFAMGNSLADLIANISVAAFAPIMGFSACFGGPMLNILLGIGISGTYINKHSGRPYTLDFSTTLATSAVGLLVILVATMVYIPWNDYVLTRRWGFFLIGSYTLSMVVNVIVELKSEG